MADKKFDLYEIVTERIIDALESNNIPWKKPWKPGGQDLPYNGASGYRYNGINVWLLTVQGYADPRWYTFNQVKKIEGATVRNGEKSTMIVYWNFVTKRNDSDDDSSSEKTIPILRYYNVFNAQQIDGLEPLASDDETVITWNHLESAESVIANYADKPLIQFVTSDKAFYRPSADSIVMPERHQFESQGEFYSTLFHELGHSTGHEKRLARTGSTEPAVFGSPVYSKEELVAEFTSAFLCAEVGIDNTLQNSTAYIKGWLQALKDDKKLLITAAAQGTKAANYILGKVQEYE